MRGKRLLIIAIGVTLLVMLVMSQMLIAPTALAKKGPPAKLSWSTNPVTATVSAGSLYTATVMVSSTVNLQNVTLRVTPSLKHTVTISPTNFTTMSAGVPYTVEIGFAAPSTVKGRPVFNGILTVREGHRALPQTLKLRFRVQK